MILNFENIVWKLKISKIFKFEYFVITQLIIKKFKKKKNAKRKEHRRKSQLQSQSQSLSWKEDRTSQGWDQEQGQRRRLTQKV